MVAEKKILNADKSAMLFEQRVSFLGGGLAEQIPELQNIVAVKNSGSWQLQLSDISESLRDFVEYIQPAGRYSINNSPNDSLYNSQWSLKKIQAPAAWLLTGNEDSIIVAIIDTGIDYLHPDVSSKIYINSGETGLDNLGRDKQTNGIDDDGNGFIDDFRGWDFTDRAGFPYDSSGGDYLDWDNDPMDDNVFSHGTSVAGIIGAETNNGIGIAGVAPKVRLMNLRSFDPDGFGEEDDVAAAVIYAVLNKAKVINMSFGDNSFSYVLRDVIRFAYSRNVVLVASAGNSNSSAPHYPSGYSEVICVGNSTSEDYVAGSSNFGSTLDLVAPGTGIVTTIRNNRYADFNGTSAAAPFISAAAALVLSKGNYTNEEVKQILKSSADDLGEPGWDLRSGAGRLNLFKAVSLLGASRVKFESPTQNFVVQNDTLSIYATILSPYFLNYSLEYGVGFNPTSWNLLIGEGKSQLINEKIFALNCQPLSDSVYTLRIKLNQSNGLPLEERVNFRILRSSAEGDLISLIPALYGNSPSILTAFYTPTESVVKMFYRPAGETEFSSISLDGFTENNYFVKKLHYGFTPVNLTRNSTTYEVYYKITNLAGAEKIVKDTLDRYFTVKTADAFNNKAYTQKNYSLQSGSLYKEPVSVSSVNNTEVFFTDLKNLTKTYLYKLEGTGFTLKDSISERIIKDFGDFNSNGKKNILANWGRDGYILEQLNTTSSKFNDIIKRENGKSWPVLAQDIDNDGKHEVIFIVNDSTASIFRVNTTGGLDSVSSFKNFSPAGFGGNVFDYPAALIDDVTGDGIKELIMTDSDGDVLCYSLINGVAVPKPDYSFSTGFLSSSAYITSGDFNSDGIRDFALLLQSVPFIDISRFHRLVVFSYQPGNLAILYDQAFVDPSGEFNLFSRRAYNTVKFANIDGHPGDELVLFAFPFSYILKQQSGGGEFIFYKEGINSNSVFTGDLDKNGVIEVAIPEADSLRFYEFTSPAGIPVALRVESTMDNKIALTWTNTAGKLYIFKSEGDNPLALFDSVSAVSYTDALVSYGNEYNYAVSIAAELLPGNNSGKVRIYHHAAASFTEYKVLTGKSLIVTFNERIKTSISNPELFSLMTDNTINPISSIAPFNQFSYIFSFQKEFSPVYNRFVWKEFRSYHNGIVRADSIEFTYIPIASNSGLFLASHKLTGAYTAELSFNLPLDSISALNSENYFFSPSNAISAISFKNGAPNTLIISTQGNKPIGSVGIEYRLQMKNIYSSYSTGRQKILDESGSIIIFSANSENLDNVYVYPSPAKSSDKLTFANLPLRAKIYIFSLSGILINELDENDGNGGLQWDLMDRNNRKIQSGIYFYKVVQLSPTGDELESKIEKFSVVR